MGRLLIGRSVVDLRIPQLPVEVSSAKILNPQLLSVAGPLIGKCVSIEMSWVCARMSQPM